MVAGERRRPAASSGSSDMIPPRASNIAPRLLPAASGAPASRPRPYTQSRRLARARPQSAPPANAAARSPCDSTLPSPGVAASICCCLLVRRRGVKRRSGRRFPAGGAWARWIERIVCARAPSLTLVHDPAVQRVGDEMFDGVIPLGEALRPLDLSGPSARARRQQQWGSRPRRIGVSEDLTRANDLLDVKLWCGGRLAGARCRAVEAKPGSSGDGICMLVDCRTIGPARAAA